MTQTTTIDGTDRSSAIKRIECEWADSAYLGEIAQGSMKIHDDSGVISVVGHKTIDTEQTACSWPTLFMGFVGRKTFSRGTTYSTGSGREITVETTDGNDLLSRRVMTASSGSDNANRPAETVNARVTWLLATSYLSGVVNDYGAVTYPSDTLDASDYRGQRPGDVLAACAKKVNFNYYVRWSDTHSGWELVFRDDNASTADTSTISITNDGTANGTTSFAPFQDASLTQDPQDVYSGVDAGYARGRTYRTRAATASAFVSRDGTTDDTGIKTLAKAQAEGDSFLFRSRSEQFALTVTLRMRAAYVNLIRAGQRVPVTLTHYTQEGFGGVTYWRVIRRRVRQPLDTDNDYDVQLDLLSPEPACSVTPTFVQQVYQARTAEYQPPAWSEDHSFDAATTAGNLLICATTSTEASGNTLVAAPAGWNWLVQNVTTDNGGGNGSYCNFLWKKSTGEQTVTFQFAQFAGVVKVTMAEYTGLANPVPYAAVVAHRENPGIGYLIVPSTSYPAGPNAIILVGFMDDGAALATGFTTNTTLRTVVPNPVTGPGPMLADILQNPVSSGATPLYPAAGNLLFNNTGGSAADYAIGVAFSGDNC